MRDPPRALTIDDLMTLTFDHSGRPLPFGARGVRARWPRTDAAAWPDPEPVEPVRARGERPMAPVARPASGAAAVRRAGELGRLLLQTTDPDDVLRLLAAGAAEVTGATRALVVHHGGPTGLVTGQAGHGLRQADVLKVRVRASSLPEMDRLRHHGRAVVLGPSAVREGVPREYAGLFGPLGTVLVAPLRGDRRGLLGAVLVDRGGALFVPDRHELDGFEQLADIAALAFENAQLFAESAARSATQERNRIATELHDGVTQEVFAAAVEVSELLATPGLPASMVPALQRLATRLDAGSRQLRAALAETAHPAPQLVEGRSVVDEVKDRLADFSRSSGVTVDVHVRGTGPPPVPQSAKVLVRTVREGLANVAKHAGATEVAVAIHRGVNWWSVEVDDDGPGDPHAVRVGMTRGPTSSFGLASLAAEAAALGGRLWIDTSPRLGGLRLSVAVPQTPET
ncbi:GAF domain-containing sensor histidine kinase [Pseudonocardia sp. H11422]|uniref:GAF domain-containing sensor histidine kinase n=1 Tax=Pseudonocardia sp. H11422 TaxID=2835866 RepID=UPI001BDC2E13|nr:GAF domain-containing sensor histidine kinase [Pseudonocardia sp. H11422]